LGAKNCLFCDGSHLHKTIADGENRAGVFTHLSQTLFMIMVPAEYGGAA